MQTKQPDDIIHPVVTLAIEDPHRSASPGSLLEPYISTIVELNASLPPEQSGTNANRDGYLQAKRPTELQRTQDSNVIAQRPTAKGGVMNK